MADLEDIVEKNNVFCSILNFYSSASEEQFLGMRFQNNLKMSSTNIPEWRRIRGRESMSKWLEDKDAISGI